MTDAKAQKAKVQEKVDNAQADLNNAKSNVADSTEAVHNAQAEVDDAKKVLDGTNAQEIIDRAKAAKGQVEVDKINVDSKQKAVEQAENNKATLESDLNKAQNDVNNANADVLAKQTEADKTQNALNTAQAERDNAHDQVSDLSDKLNSINTIVLPDGYVSSWKSGANDSVFVPYAEKGYALNGFKHSKADEKNQSRSSKSYTRTTKRTDVVDRRYSKWCT